MKILSIESASMTASVALLSEDTVLFSYSTCFKKTHSETLLPMIDTLKNETGLDLAGLDAVAVSEGPGSFTGLRIGAATAKGIAYALNIPVIPVPTLAAMAYVHFGSGSLVCPMLDARRDQVYCALYVFEGGRMITLQDRDLVSASEMVSRAEKAAGERNTSVLYMGDGAEVYREQILASSLNTPLFAAPHMMHENAAAGAALAKELFKSGKTVSAADFAPVYLRKSQAEQEREAKGLPLE